MIDSALQTPTNWRSAAMQKRIASRYAAERRFRGYGVAALTVATAFLAFLLYTIISAGASGFMTTKIKLDVTLDPALLGVDASSITGPDKDFALSSADFGAVTSAALVKALPDVPEDKISDLNALVSQGALLPIRKVLEDDPKTLGSTVSLWVIAGTQVDLLVKGQFDKTLAEGERGVSNDMVQWIGQLKADERLKRAFNWHFLTGSDSQNPELAAIWGATKGTLMTLFVTLMLCFPIGILTAIYLEEFAPKNLFTDFIEVNINNLAAVPSIIFGLLGLAVFLGAFGMTRSAPVVGGLTLALMTLPTIVISSRVAFKAVPPSIRDAAMGIGASPMQVVFHHLMPLALPGILTGTIIGMARALGETAPLIMIGMRTFVPEAPSSFTEAATVLPMQIFLWSDSIERGFIEKTSAAIMILLLFLVLMNSLAIYLRNRFEQRW
jgi:phosphate transport system permease protein